jgi:hypothetical protein
LLTPWELSRVLGWQGLGASGNGAAPLANLVSTGPTGGLNPNTAAPTVFAALTGLDQRGAARFVAYRAAHPIANAADLAAVVDVAVTEAMQLVFAPSNILRVTLAAEGDPLLHVSTIRLNPGGPAPYRVDYAIAVPQSPAIRAAVLAAGLPSFPLSRSGD